MALGTGVAHIVGYGCNVSWALQTSELIKSYEPNLLINILPDNSNLQDAFLSLSVITKPSVEKDIFLLFVVFIHFIGCARGPSVQYRLPYTTDIAIRWTRIATASTFARIVLTPSPYPTWSR